MNAVLSLLNRFFAAFVSLFLSDFLLITLFFSCYPVIFL